MDVVGVIPARLESTRLYRKMLADVHGHPLLWHVCQRVLKAKSIDRLYVATDSILIKDAVFGWGIPVLMTSSDCNSGTDRLAEAMNDIRAEFILNIQGDEPLVDPNMLDVLVQHWRHSHNDLVTPIRRIYRLEELTNSNVVKVVVDRKGRAIYFSRSPVPHVRDIPMSQWLQSHNFWAHLGVYGYHRYVLATFPHLPESGLEKAESLEQLRFLEAGFTIGTIVTTNDSISVDTLEDLERVREFLLAKPDQDGLGGNC